MIHASEAAQKSFTYIKNYRDDKLKKMISDIERTIKSKAELGYRSCIFTLKFIRIDLILKSLQDELHQSGYTTEIVSTDSTDIDLIISW
jgi:hypothetical protein